jgi:hypothetical protein
VEYCFSEKEKIKNSLQLNKMTLPSLNLSFEKHSQTSTSLSSQNTNDNSARNNVVVDIIPPNSPYNSRPVTPGKNIIKNRSTTPSAIRNPIGGRASGKLEKGKDDDEPEITIRNWEEDEDEDEDNEDKDAVPNQVTHPTPTQQLTNLPGNGSGVQGPADVLYK